MNTVRYGDQCDEAENRQLFVTFILPPVVVKIGVIFIKILRAIFLSKSALRCFSLVMFWLCNFLEQKYCRKSCSKNVDEIDYSLKLQFTSYLHMPD